MLRTYSPRPDPCLGPKTTNLFRVKGIPKIVVTCDGMEWRYRGPVSSTTQRPAPNAGTTVLLIRHDSDLLNLAFVPEAIAVAIDDGVEDRIFWFDENGIHVEHNQMMAAARASVESICCLRDGYPLMT